MNDTYSFNELDTVMIDYKPYDLPWELPEQYMVGTIIDRRRLVEQNQYMIHITGRNYNKWWIEDDLVLIDNLFE